MYGLPSISSLDQPAFGARGFGLSQDSLRAGGLLGAQRPLRAGRLGESLMPNAGGVDSVAAISGESRDTRAFLDALRARATQAASAATGSGTSSDQEADPARAAAEEFVALTFVQPILKQLRESNQTAAPFAPGQAEKAFQGLADEEIAKRIVRASQWGLVDRIASDLAKAQKPAETPATATVDRGA